MQYRIENERKREREREGERERDKKERLKRDFDAINAMRRSVQRLMTTHTH